ncbi:MAG TPA: DEAD/DEAH box helicase, partial [Albitalea sp.]|nr:DEAD/DEAH box helicase [Albitalea sp.]
MATLSVGGHSLTLLPQKAAFLDDVKTLLIADAHIGKAVSFRRWGVPVPRGTTTETLTALGDLVRQAGALRVVFLGDLLHS